jgi:hypothetical protein
MSPYDIPVRDGSVSMSSSVFVVLTLGLLSVGTSVVIDGFFFGTTLAYFPLCLA